MTDDDDNMFRRPTGTRMERAQEIMSRAHCMRPEAALTEDEIERKNIEAKLRMEHHDFAFSREFVDVGALTPLSRKLASQLGFSVEPADTGDDMGTMGNPDPTPQRRLVEDD